MKIGDILTDRILSYTYKVLEIKGDYYILIRVENGQEVPYTKNSIHKSLIKETVVQ